MSLEIRDLSTIAYAMTRIAAKVTGTTVIFSPSQALQPAPADPKDLGPRQMQYPVAVNLSRQPRRDFPALTPFETLRYYCGAHALAALAIRVRSEQVAALPGQVVARDKRQQAALQADCDAASAWLATPDGSTPRASWLKALIRDLLEIDAPTIYRRPARGGGLASLELIDGSTIKPVIDLGGRVVGYQQVLYGLALSQYQGSRPAMGEEVIVGEYSPGELWYQPYTPRIASPYGRPPMEDLLTYARIAVQKQGYDLAHFTDGNIPAAMAILEDGAGLNPDQLATFEANFNVDLQANPARAGYMKFVPFPMRIERLAELSTGGAYESAFEEYMVKLTMAFYAVTPSEVGFTADVNRATSDGQEGVTYRVGIRPLAEWLKVMVFDPVIQGDMGLTGCEWRWDFGEREDRESEARIHQGDVAAGVLSAQDSRAMRYPDLGGQAPGPQGALGVPTPALAAPPGGLPKLLKAGEAPRDQAGRARSERELARLVAAAFAAQRGRLAAFLGEAANRVAGALDSWFGTELTPMIRALLPFYDATLAAGAAEGLELLAVGANWDEVNAAVLALARAEAAKLAGEINATTQAQAAQILADWIATGGELEELTDRLELLYPAARAEMIGVTEVTRLYAAGNLAAWRASDVVTGYRIETAADERVCPVCGPLRGTLQPLEGGELPPFHPRCRCWIVPEVE